ncbi:MAG: S41 family peptidase [Gemmatimonadaceae bacterium]|nr:S41 family peptidase [Gemmatimonadaceae bacterium]
MLTPLTVRAQTPVIPDTPAGVVLRAWFDAYASGDTSRILDFLRRYQPDRIGQSSMSGRIGMAGFQLVSIEKSDPRRIEFIAREGRTRGLAYGAFELAPGDPIRIMSSMLSPIPPNVAPADLSIDASSRVRVIGDANAQLDSFYVFPKIAKQIADSLQTRSRRGVYDTYTNKMTFAAKLNSELRELSRDKHMVFNYMPFLPRPANAPAPRDPVPGALDREEADLLNCGFVKVEQLEDNIGYVKFDGFFDVEMCGETASAAMTFVAGTRALIVDLRENGGGSPAMVSYVSSYLFSERTHLSDIWNRRTGRTEEFWTRDRVSGRRFGATKPVFVLTSASTFSGGEEFAYNLKVLKRATIVGEVTGGGAHPVGPRPVGSDFVIAVPHSRSINPITLTNWEGVGVEPDIKVPAADALAAAIKRLSRDPRP